MAEEHSTGAKAHLLQSTAHGTTEVVPFQNPTLTKAVQGARNGDAPSVPLHRYRRSASALDEAAERQCSGALVSIQSIGLAESPPAAAI